MHALKEVIRKNALTLNRCVNDTDVAKAILDDYIEVNKEYWPELK